MTENFPNLVKDKDKQVQETQISRNLDPKKPTLRHIISKMARLKDKERILKAIGEKQVFTTRELKLDWHLISQQKHFRPEGSSMKYSR